MENQVARLWHDYIWTWYCLEAKRSKTSSFSRTWKKAISRTSSLICLLLLECSYQKPHYLSICRWADKPKYLSLWLWPCDITFKAWSGFKTAKVRKQFSKEKEFAVAKIEKPKFQWQVLHFQTVLSWTNQLSPLCFQFLACDIGEGESGAHDDLFQLYEVPKFANLLMIYYRS